MSDPTWFNQNYYLANKVAAMNAAGQGGRTDWTAAEVLQTLEASGLTPYQHYLDYGAQENLSPNPSFNPAYYLEQKAAQLNAGLAAGETPWTTASVLAAMVDAGLTPMEHYQAFGADENLNPNQYFDQSYYLNAKAAAQNAVAAQGRTDWTAAAVLQDIEAAGLTPYAHFAAYGVNEGLNPSENFDIQSYLQHKADSLNAANAATTWTAAEVLASMEASGLDPVSHYIAYGNAEGITPDPVIAPPVITPPPVDTAPQLPAFYTIVTAGVLSFGGTATGEVTIAMPDATHAEFTRGGHTLASQDLAGITTIDLPDNHGSITVTMAQALMANHTAFATGDTVTVTDIVDLAAALTDYTTATLGGSTVSLDAGGAAWTVTAAQLDAALGGGIVFADTETLTITDIADTAEATALTAYAPSVIGGSAVTLTARDGTWVLGAATLDTALAGHIAFAVTDTVTVTDIADTTAALAAHTTATVGCGTLLLDAQTNAWDLDGAALPAGTTFGADDVLSIDVSGIDANAAVALSTTVLGGASILLGGVATATMTVSQADILAATTTWAATVALTLTGDAASLAAMPYANYKPDRLGGSTVTLDASGAPVTLTADQAAALVLSGLTFAADDALVVTGIEDGNESAALTGYTTATLGGSGVVLASQDHHWTVTADALRAAYDAGVTFAATETVSVTAITGGTEATALADFTTAKLGCLAVVLDADSDHWDLNAASLPAGVTFAADDAITVTVDAPDVATAEALAIGTLGGTSITLTGDGSVTLTASQAANQDAHTKWSGNDDITLVDTDTALAALNFDNCTTSVLGGKSVTLNATNNVVSLTSDQADALLRNGLRFDAASDALTVAAIDAGKETIALTSYSTGSLGGKSVTLDAADDAWDLNLATLPSGIKFGAGDVLNFLVDDAEVASALALSQTSLGGAGILLTGDGTVTLTVAQAASQATVTMWSAGDDLTVTGSGSALACLTFANYKTSRLGGHSVSLDADDDAVSLTTSQADALLASGLKFAASDVVTVTGITDTNHPSSLFDNYNPEKLGGNKVILSAAPNTFNERLWNIDANSLSGVLGANIDFAADNNVVISVNSTSLTGTSAVDLLAFNDSSGTDFTITNLGVGDVLSFNQFYSLVSMSYDKTTRTLSCTAESWSFSRSNYTIHLDGVDDVGWTDAKILQITALD